MKKCRVLIADHEESTRQSLVSAFGNAGFEVWEATDGSTALRLVQQVAPDAVLLALWLPEMDGLTTLRALHAIRQDTAVVMMSGHGNVATAVKAMQLGACDYLEKPFSPDQAVALVKRVSMGVPFPLTPCASTSLASYPPAELSISPLTPRVGHFSRHPQRTLRRSVVCYGQGLQSGLKTGLMLKPLPPNSGLLFRDLVTGKTLPATVHHVASTDFCTSLRRGDIAVQTIEHLLSALHAYEITNLLMTVSDEVPILDGSAADFCQLLEGGGIVEQDAEMEEFVIDRCYHVGDIRRDEKFILIEPYDGFRITYRLVYPPPLGVQEFTYEHLDSESYRQAIAPARTFGFMREVAKMQEMGLIAGGRLHNVILIDDEKIINPTQLRFADECARHKVLDIMGDLYLLGTRLRGHVWANMTGHADNVALVRRLAEAMSCSVCQ